MILQNNYVSNTNDIVLETNSNVIDNKNYPSHLKKRGVWWFVDTYADPSEFDLALKKAIHWAYIYHDKDDNENHYHVLLHYDNARTGHAVLKDFASTKNSFCEPAKSPLSCYEYLIHANDPDKFQYDISSVITNDPFYWENFLPSVREFNQADFIEDLLYSEKLDFVYMARKYGRDFIKNYKNYLEYRNIVRLDLNFVNN